MEGILSITCRENPSRTNGGLVSVSKLRFAVGLSEIDAEPTVIHAAYLAICTGLHVIPSIPDVPGIHHVLKKAPRQAGNNLLQPAVYHSAEYKKRAQLTGRRVMILGTGETGMDLAYEAAKGGAEEVVLCTRGG